jgi:hypothetical protein
MSKNANQSCANKIIEHITSTSLARPRKKASVTVYGDLYKAKLKKSFDLVWELAKGSTEPHQRLSMRNDHVKACWEKEMPEVRDKVTKHTEEENAQLMAAWKKKASFTGSPEGLVE